MRAVLLCSALLMFLSAAGASAQEVAHAEFRDGQGRRVGEATISQTPRYGVLIRASFDGLPAGTRAFHIHEVGRCDAPDFQSAGGHFNPFGREHGWHNPRGAHAGDLPNLHVPESGRLTIEVLAFESLLSARAVSSLLGGGGRALVVHEGTDDYRTDPTGDAGGRVACAVIVRR
jgi:superoxide dismutase, Cu-Zn family